MDTPVCGPRTTRRAAAAAGLASGENDSSGSATGAKRCVEPSSLKPQCGHAASSGASSLLHTGHFSVMCGSFYGCVG